MPCIPVSAGRHDRRHHRQHHMGGFGLVELAVALAVLAALLYFCLLYTSDAADERSSVDLGGRRIIKTTKTHQRANVQQLYDIDK